MSTRSSTESRASHENWMARALQRAREGMALAHPNPRVGAVIVKDGRVVGEGFHEYDKREHAEIVALNKAGAAARGATMYVSLEPCCTTGRTGPCTQAIIAAGVKKVYAAMEDPNPAVAGRGIAELKRAGVEVHTGVHEEHGRKTNEDFAKWIRTGLPFVTLKSALTLDGQIAMRAGKSTPITEAAAREYAQQLRHEADALVTGIGTVLADDPLLTDRTGERRRRPLLRVVLDSRLRIPLKSRLVKSARDDVIVFTTRASDSPKARALEKAGIEIVRTRNRRGRVCFDSVLADLGKREILGGLLEAGAELNGAALEARIVDKMTLLYSPRVMGTGGVPMAAIPAAKWFPKARALRDLSVHACGPDFVVEGYFRDVYRDHRRHREN